jgi:hypothetical protein
MRASGFSILHPNSIGVVKSSIEPQKQTALDKREARHSNDCGYARLRGSFGEYMPESGFESQKDRRPDGGVSVADHPEQLP